MPKRAKSVGFQNVNRRLLPFGVFAQAMETMNGAIICIWRM